MTLKSADNTSNMQYY